MNQDSSIEVSVKCSTLPNKPEGKPNKESFPWYWGVRGFIHAPRTMYAFYIQQSWAKKTKSLWHEGPDLRIFPFLKEYPPLWVPSCLLSFCPYMNSIFLVA